MTDLFEIDWGMGPTETTAPAQAQEEHPESTPEPKGRKTRSHLKAKVYETSDKFEYRRAFSEIQLLDTLGGGVPVRSRQSVPLPDGGQHRQPLVFESGASTAGRPAFGS